MGGSGIQPNAVLRMLGQTYRYGPKHSRLAFDCIALATRDKGLFSQALIKIFTEVLRFF